MAHAIPPFTWENGFRQPSTGTPWAWPQEESRSNGCEETVDDETAYVSPPSVELVTSTAHNHLGINVIRNWPTMYDGTNSPHGLPEWWEPKEEVDVLISGAGPSGLAIAASLARQGVSFRILDKSSGPLIAGRADGVQPRFLETIALLGLAPEIHEEGPLIERTAIYKNGKKLLFNRSHQSDSRYRGLHIITQGQIERIYVRDLARHKALVERSSMLESYTIDDDPSNTYPIHAKVNNNATGKSHDIRAKYLVGSDGAASTIRKGLNIPFDGVSTDIYWGIMDCIFLTDYPHAWCFGSVISSEHGGCVIIPREDGYIRLYTQLNVSQTGAIAASRLAKDPNLAEAGGRVDINTITPEEVLEQANRIFAPYKLEFGAPLSWFAIWKISERVARSYSSPDNRVHLVGDAAHVHSVMGAFGLNASMLDAANLSWKLGLASKGKAKPDVLLDTYGSERRGHAVRIIEVSGTYLRFVCGSALHVPNLSDIEALEKEGSGDEVKHQEHSQKVNGKTNGHLSEEEQRAKDLEFLGNFFKAHGTFLLGVECPYGASVIAPVTPEVTSKPSSIRVKNGVRAPNPRLCLGTNKSGYLYDTFEGPPRFHLVLFASSLGGSVMLNKLSKLVEELQRPDGFYNRYGGADMFHTVVVTKLMPFEVEDLKSRAATNDKISAGRIVQSFQELGADIAFDDRAPDEDAHTTWGANHTTGGLAVIRPDLWVGITAAPDDVDAITKYFEGFMA
ncbi:FAD binding domain-containing protein [Stachybotrys elegans]|uniref:FAD binding domain-containing protein n=1 Tax=Stachybotrys elegans TaxID=80388 RepID=A0A8K0WJF6_9HYPO|nr:FAD binding domain-containing protein [Stachybotrys elegans]